MIIRNGLFGFRLCWVRYSRRWGYEAASNSLAPPPCTTLANDSLVYLHYPVRGRPSRQMLLNKVPRRSGDLTTPIRAVSASTIRVARSLASPPLTTNPVFR